MITHLRQAFNHDPQNNVYGDCHRTAIAMVVGYERDVVPPPTQEVMESPEAFDTFYDQWFKLYGWQALTVTVVAVNPEAAVEIGTSIAKSHGQNHPFILGGASSRGCNHSVAVYDGKVYDPHPSDEGIVGPMIHMEAESAYSLTFVLGPVWIPPRKPVWTPMKQSANVGPKP